MAKHDHNCVVKQTKKLHEVAPRLFEAPHVVRKGACHLKEALIGGGAKGCEQVEESHIDLAAHLYASSAGRCISIRCLPLFSSVFLKCAEGEQMKFSLCTTVPHSVSLAVLDEGGDVLEH